MAYSNDKKWYAQKLIIQERGFDISDFLDKQIKDETWNTDFGSEPTTSELTTAWENYENKQYQRDREKKYLSELGNWQDQLDMIYDDIDNWKSEVKKIKDANPKE